MLNSSTQNKNAEFFYMITNIVTNVIIIVQNNTISLEKEQRIEENKNFT